MGSIFNFEQVPILVKTDVLVVGGGSAGCVAALGARESRKYKVLLIERYGFPGGSSTQMLDTFYGFFTPGDTPKKVVGGLPDRVVNKLDETRDIFLRPNTYGAGTGVNYNPERLKWVWDHLLESAGVKVALHTPLVAVEQLGDHQISCVVWHKSGFFKIITKKVIDASGDADFCHLAGLSYEKAGDTDPAQSMTTTFRMSNVDLEKYEREGGKKMAKAKMAEAVEKGTHPLPRKEGSAHEMVQRGCISTVAVKVADLDPLDVFQMSQAEKEGRKQAFIYEKFFQDEIPGYENSQIIGLSHQIGVRETRRVFGEKRLTKEDCMSGKVENDSILLCGAPIEDHRKGKDGQSETFWQYVPNGGVYGVSYGTIVPKGMDNVWVVGRCFSATHDAHASCRSMGQTMGLGMAAGLATSMALDKNYGAKDLDVKQLREVILEKGGILEFPDKAADVSRDGWKNN